MLTIGKLAETTGISRDTIRFYERVQLLAPASRTDTGYRLYTDSDVRRIAFIKQAQLCGFSLEVIRKLLQPVDGPTARGGSAYRTAVAEREPLDRRIDALQTMRDTLNAFIAKCDAGEAEPLVASGQSGEAGASGEEPAMVPWPESERTGGAARANTRSSHPERAHGHTHAGGHAQEHARASSGELSERRTGERND